MNFAFDEVQQMLADSIEKFIANDYQFETRQKNVSSELGYSTDVWQTFSELGWTAVPFSEADGGFDGGAVEMMIVMERLGRALVVEPYLANVVLAGGVLRRAANAAQKTKWLSPLIDGTLQATLAFAEPQSRYDYWDIATTASKSSDAWMLSGSKAFVPNGGNADFIIVPARTSGDQDDKHGITLFGVVANSSGVSVREFETIDGHRGAEVSLQNVQLDSDCIIGIEGNGLPALQGAIFDATFALCAEAVGIMTVLTEKTIAFTKERVQFGVPISSFQALQHRMVDMYTACEQSRSLLMWAAMNASSTTANADENQQGPSIAMHSLKYQIGIAGTKVGEEAVQIHGGMGVTWELDVAHYFKRLTAINLMFGSADWHLDQLSQNV